MIKENNKWKWQSERDFSMWNIGIDICQITIFSEKIVELEFTLKWNLYKSS